jgi:hypothetical protein
LENTMKQSSSRLPARWLAPLALAASALLAACGGGSAVDGGTPPTTTVQSYLTGRITGFGSVIVNGVRLDDSGADISDDDGARRGSDDLKLGMVVEVKAGRIDDGTSSGSASVIVVRSEIKGPIEAIDAAAGTLTVLGQALTTDAATVYEDTTGLAALAVGGLVEVYAVPATDGTLRATRIEAKTTLEHFKLRGSVAGLDPAARTFRIGTALISYAGLGEVIGLADGLFVKVKLATVPVDGAWVATKLRSGEREIEVEDRDEAEVEGTVSGFVSLADFKVGGVPVDASGATVSFERGTAADVVDGARVEVEGRIVNGVLVAREVKIEDGDEDDDGRDDDGEVELHGAIESVDAANGRFVVRGVTVTWNAGTAFKDLTAAGLVVGARVEVEAQLAADGTTVVALEIELDD